MLRHRFDVWSYEQLKIICIRLNSPTRLVRLRSLDISTLRGWCWGCSAIYKVYLPSNCVLDFLKNNINKHINDYHIFPLKSLVPNTLPDYLNVHFDFVNAKRVLLWVFLRSGVFYCRTRKEIIMTEWYTYCIIANYYSTFQFILELTEGTLKFINNCFCEISSCMCYLVRTTGANQRLGGISRFSVAYDGTNLLNGYFK